jgi:TonB-dependent receptor
LETAGEALAQLGFDTRREKIAPNGNFGAAGGGSFAFNESTQLSLLGAMRITNTWESNEELRRRYATSDGQTLFANSAATRNVTDRLGTLTGFLNATLTFGEGQRIQATSMLLRQSSDQTQVEDGFKDSPTDIARDTELEWNENSLISNQLSGENYFSNFNDLSLTWQITDARAARESPAKRSYTYFNSQGQYFFLPTTGGNQIAYEDLDDASREYRVGASMPWSVSENSAVTFSAGIGRLERDRQSDLRRFLFSPNSNSVITPDILRRPLNDILTPQNIGPNGFQLVEVTRTLDNYVGSQSLDSVFVNADWMFGEHWRFVGGVRRENNDQFISTFDIATPNLGRVNATSKAVKWLPALATTYSFAEGQQQLRFSYGRSVSRPDFREYSPAPFLDPILDIESFGNAKLKPTGINNFDLRWERYFDGDESVSAALFYKEFDLPIERVSVAGTGGLLSYENAESARNIGIELEGFLRLGRVNDALQDFFVSANTSVLQSTVKLGAAGAAQTTQSRPLQGQSKYLVNMQLGYKPDDGKWEATALYNDAGRRIARVSSFPLPDIYETPFHQLDFTARYRFADEWTMGFRLKNLLDQSVEYTQGGLPTRRYKSGREFGFSIEWAPEFR